jgi:signal peptidase I
MMRRLARRIERALALLGLLFVVYHAAFRLARMTSGSMQPTLQGRSFDDGDTVLVETLTGRWRRPRRFEIVAFHTNEGLPVMKRVFAFPGETIALRDGRFVVDGADLALPAHLRGRRYYAYGNLTRGAAVACRAGYYVLGDDSQDSQDSRFEGPIPASRIAGRAWAILAPTTRAGFVH